MIDQLHFGRDRASQNDVLDVRLARFLTRLSTVAASYTPGATAALYCLLLGLLLFGLIIGASRVVVYNMSASSIMSAKSDPTPDSSPPPANMDDGSVSKAMQDEETRMTIQREKRDAKRDAQLEKERQEDIQSGKEILDKKFQQLEFLMNKSRVNLLHQVCSFRG